MKKVFILLLILVSCTTKPDILVVKSDEGNLVLYADNGIENMYIIDATTGKEIVVKE